MAHNPFDDLKQAAEHLARAAESATERVLGEDVQSSLREAARHVVRAARHSLDRFEDCLDGCGRGDSAPGAAESCADDSKGPSADDAAQSTPAPDADRS